MMETFENTVTIRRPPDDVFAFLADLVNVPSWNHAIESTTKTSAGPVGVGSTYRQIRSQPRRSEEASVVSKLLAPLAASRVKAAVAENLDSLRRILESDRRSSG